MFANENSINNLESLVKEIKKYIELQGQYIKLDIVEKLTVLLSTLILILILIVLGMMALFYFSFMLVYASNPLWEASSEHTPLSEASSCCWEPRYTA
mgnify:CR=1 FL=1